MKLAITIIILCTHVLCGMEKVSGLKRSLTDAEQSFTVKRKVEPDRSLLSKIEHAFRSNDFPGFFIWVDCATDYSQKELLTVEVDFKISMHWAAYHNNCSALIELRKHGIPIEVRTSDGAVPLHRAAEMGSLDALRYLIDSGAKIDATATNGYTPLHYAAYYGQQGAIELLVQSGASLEARENSGETPLLSSINQDTSDQNALAAVRCLKALGANSNARTKRGFTALHNAAWAGHIHTIDYLLDLKIPIDIVDEEGVTPFHAAILGRGRTDVIEHLLRNGANLEARTRTGKTALLLAIEIGRADIAKLLLQAGADIQNDFLAIVEFLVTGTWRCEANKNE